MITRRIPFVEGINTLDRRVMTYVSNSMDTSAVDAYRQGVELTLDRHFQQGIVKIWSGLPGHAVDLNEYGQRDDDIFPEATHFEEVEKFNPQLSLTDYYNDRPIIIDSAIGTNENGFDGIIEPLSIRKVASFTSTDSPYESHAVRGSLESGNYDPFRNADQVVSRYKFKEVAIGQSFYEDNVNMTGRIPTNLGFWPTISTRVLPYDDSAPKDGVIVPAQASSDFVESLKGMSPPTENYVPNGYVRTSAQLTPYEDWYTPNS